MANFNKVILMGNLTRDVEMRYTQGGMEVAHFGMAVNRRGKNGQESTCFVDCKAFGKVAELLNGSVGKGSPLHIDGRLDYSQWEAKDGGGKRSKLEVIVENFQFLAGREGAKAGSQGQQSKEGADYGDIPF